jgi:hypothetical protein
MYLFRFGVARFFEDISIPDKEAELAGKNSIVLRFDKNLAVIVVWIDIGDDVLEIFSDRSRLATVIENLDSEMGAVRDVYSFSAGSFGVIRAVDPFTCLVTSIDDSDFHKYSQISSIAPPEGFGISVKNIIERKGYISPSPTAPDAARLLSLANSEHERLASVVGYTKLFENAFGMHNEGKLIERLMVHFKGTKFGYEKSEIRSWFNFRGEDVHASKRIAKFDQRKYDLPLLRLRQAAYDVAYNKREWGDKRSLRTERTPIVIWYKKDGSVFVDRPGINVEFIVKREVFGDLYIDQIMEDGQRGHVRDLVYKFISEKMFPDSKSLWLVGVFGQNGNISFKEWSEIAPNSPVECQWNIEGPH